MLKAPKNLESIISKIRLVKNEIFRLVKSDQKLVKNISDDWTQVYLGELTQEVVENQ